MNKFKIFIPGRIEILGNHTDHQNGKVICSPISLGNIVTAEKNSSKLLIVKSLEYGIIKIDITNFKVIKNSMPNNSKKMVIGILEELLRKNYKIAGANIKIKSNLPVGIGLGSSAAFCLSIICSLDGLFNLNISNLDKSKICKCVENNYTGKACGLMDQIACLSEGPVKIDFKDQNYPIITNLQIPNFNDNYSVCIIDTGSKHDNLTKDYTEINKEMELVANYFNKLNLREVNEKKFMKIFNHLRGKIPDRAISRSYHYFKENNRVDLLSTELNKNKIDLAKILKLINDSNYSSEKFLQNYYSIYNDDRSLIINDIILKELLKENYAAKICGGGFGGSIILIVESKKIEILKKIFGDNVILFDLHNQK